jgi:MFS transporter, AAHS family, benzoate transport protein
MTDRVLTQPHATTARRSGARTSIFITAICWLMVVIEGYDLIGFSTVVPVLLRDPSQGYTPGNIGWVASAVFTGALIGALSSGWLADRYGRRPVAVASLLVFTLFTVLCGFAAGPVSLAFLRLLAGIGIGAIVPAASALTMEYALPRHRTLAYTVMLSGVPLGGVIAALVALVVLPGPGWRWMFFLGVVLLVVVLPIVLRWLPESVTFLDAAGRTDEAAAVRRRLALASAEQTDPQTSPEHAGIFRPGYLGASILFAMATFCGLFAWFGLATWLPGIMRQSGYELGSSLLFLLVLNLGAVAGSLFIALATDRWGNRLVVVLTYIGMTAALILLSVRLPQPPLLAAIALAGIGGHGGQILINAFVGRSYPAVMRARGLGWSLGAGRLGTIVGPVVIGWIVSGHDPRLGFVVFAVVAATAAAVLSVIPRTPAFIENAL